MLSPTFANAYDAEANPVNDLGLFKQGVQLSTDGEWSNAERIFRGIAERNPSWPEPKNNLAVALYKTGKLEQSHQAFEDAVTSLPSFKTAQINRQRLYDYSATLAYNKAVGNNNKPGMPTLELLNDVKDISSIVKKANTDGDKNTDEAFNQVKNSLLQWSKSWLNSDVDEYLSAYSSEFVPPSHIKDFEHWSKIRKAKLLKGNIDRVSLDSIQVYLDNNKQQALAQFVQDYKSRNYEDKVLKQVRMTYTNNRWLIVSEEVLRELK